ncbi:MAG: hypothetical protein IKS41_05850 [Alphaproteobacteria bacterium]|nr:hypothetical protein [Alphaproteobacteria bacterium]
MSPKMKKFLNLVGKIFKVKEKEVPTNQDALGAYPLRMQISAIPERRYLRTARLLAVITFLNLGVLMVLAGVFSWRAVRQNIKLVRFGQQQLYMMDPEYKVIQSAETSVSKHYAEEFLMEQGVQDYIKSRYNVYLDGAKQQQSWKYVIMYSNKEKLTEFEEREKFVLTESARRKRVNHEVHIYSIRLTPGNLWEALVDVFEMKPRDPYNPVCDCYDNSRECLKCKEELNVGRSRYRMFVRASFGGNTSLNNPTGFLVENIYVIPQIVHPDEQFWNIPSILKPEL